QEQEERNVVQQDDEEEAEEQGEAAHREVRDRVEIEQARSARGHTPSDEPAVLQPGDVRITETHGRESATRGRCGSLQARRSPRKQARPSAMKGRRIRARSEIRPPTINEAARGAPIAATTTMSLPTSVGPVCTPMSLSVKLITYPYKATTGMYTGRSRRMSGFERTARRRSQVPRCSGTNGVSRTRKYTKATEAVTPSPPTRRTSAGSVPSAFRARNPAPNPATRPPNVTRSKNAMSWARFERLEWSLIIASVDATFAAAPIPNIAKNTATR